MSRENTGRNRSIGSLVFHQFGATSRHWWMDSYPCLLYLPLASRCLVSLSRLASSQGLSAAKCSCIIPPRLVPSQKPIVPPHTSPECIFVPDLIHVANSSLQLSIMLNFSHDLARINFHKRKLLSNDTWWTHSPEFSFEVGNWIFFVYASNLNSCSCA